LVLLSFGSVDELKRFGTLIRSVTGTEPDQIDVEEVQSARSRSRYAVSVTTSNAIRPSASRTPRSGAGHSESGASDSGVDGVLKALLDRGSDAQVEAWTQTDGHVDVCQCAVQATVSTEARAVSPISAAWPHVATGDTIPDDRSETTNGGSDFEHEQIWRTLQPQAKRNSPRTPSTAVANRTRSGRHHVDLSSTVTAVDEKEGRNTSGLDSFLGVLSGFSSSLASKGFDQPAKLSALSEAELDKLMDEIGMQKEGHRIMLHSKVALLRQARQLR